MGWLCLSNESSSSKALSKNIVFRERASRSLPRCFLLKLGVKFVATCQLLSEVFLSGWKKVRLNFTCQICFKTFPLLWDVCGRTSQLDLDLLYNYPNCWGSKYFVNITKPFRILPTAARLEFPDNFGNFRVSFYGWLYKMWTPQNNNRFLTERVRAVLGNIGPRSWQHDLSKLGY